VKVIENVTIRQRAYDFLLLFYIVTMALSRDLEIPVKGQSRSLKVVPFDRFGMVSS